MFNWLKKLFGKKEPVAQIQITEAPKLPEKPCRNCGNPVFYDPSWEHIPNYCKDCKRKFQQSNAKAITRKCRNCGRKISFPSTIEHYPNYCKECRMKFREKKAHE